MNIYSIRDNKAETYNTPWYSVNDATAKRSFAQAVNDPNHDLAKDAQDYDLFWIGLWDDQTGHILPAEAPKHLCNGLDMKGKN